MLPGLAGHNLLGHAWRQWTGRFILVSAHRNPSAARRALLQEKDVEVVSTDGVVRRSAVQIHDKDQIISPRQGNLFFT